MLRISALCFFIFGFSAARSFAIEPATVGIFGPNRPSLPYGPRILVDPVIGPMLNDVQFGGGFSVVVGHHGISPEQISAATEQINGMMPYMPRRPRVMVMACPSYCPLTPNAPLTDAQQIFSGIGQPRNTTIYGPMMPNGPGGGVIQVDSLVQPNGPRISILSVRPTIGYGSYGNPISQPFGVVVPGGMKPAHITPYLPSNVYVDTGGGNWPEQGFSGVPRQPLGIKPMSPSYAVLAVGSAFASATVQDTLAACTDGSNPGAMADPVFVGSLAWMQFEQSINFLDPNWIPNLINPMRPAGIAATNELNDILGDSEQQLAELKYKLKYSHGQERRSIRNQIRALEDALTALGY